MLSIDKLRLIDDARFRLSQASSDWTLVVAQPKESDGGESVGES